MLVGGPQLLVGTVVNMLLAWLVMIDGDKRMRWAAMIPSTAAVLHGVLFGAFTPFLVYMLPVIWLGNWVYMWVWGTELKGIVRIVGSAGIKAAILWLAAVGFYQLRIIPLPMVMAMGVAQLVTATGGGLLAVGLEKIRVKVYE